MKADRFNSNKPMMELVPLNILAKSLNSKLHECPKNLAEKEENTCIQVLSIIGDFQMKSDTVDLYSALSLFNEYWTYCADAFAYGAKKYSSWNWTKGTEWSIPIGCIARHCLKLLNGEALDAESGVHHFGHIMCNLIMLIYYSEKYPELNDLLR